MNRVLRCILPDLTTVQQVQKTHDPAEYDELHFWHKIDLPGSVRDELVRRLTLGNVARTGPGYSTPDFIKLFSQGQTREVLVHRRNGSITMRDAKANICIVMDDKGISEERSRFRVDLPLRRTHLLRFALEAQAVSLYVDDAETPIRFRIPDGGLSLSVESTDVVYWNLTSSIRWFSFAEPDEIERYYEGRPSLKLIDSIRPMRFVFYDFIGEGHQHINAYSYNAYTDNSAFSGVQASVLELSAILSQMGHDVTLCVTPYKGTPMTDRLGIHYCGHDQVKDWSTVDVFCVSHFPFDYIPVQIYNRLSQHTKLVTWFHHRIDRSLFKGYDILVKSGFDVRFAYPSRYASLPYFENDFTKHQAFIGGGINPDLFPASLPDSTGKEGKWIFHAGIGRGVDTSIEVFKRCSNAKQFSACFWHANSDEDASKIRDLDARVRIAGRLGKRELIEELCKSDYFVYCLACKGAAPYHDTYSQCVLEAMACGVIVVSWDIACLREVYGDRIVLIEPPADYDPNADPQEHGAFYSEEAIGGFVEAIEELERHPQMKETIRRRAFEWARRQTWDARADALIELCRD